MFDNKLNLVFCARFVTLDSTTNNISAFNILEEVISDSFPIMLPELSVCAFWESPRVINENFQIILEVKLNENTLFEQELTQQFQGKLRFRNVINFQGLTLDTPGKLKFSFYSSDRKKLLGSHELAVIKK